MERALSLYDTTIGKKAVIAVTGIILYGFAIVHMLGNLQVFSSPHALNDYANALRTVPPLLWTARLVLLASAIVHAVLTIQLVMRSAAARRVGYRKKQNEIANYASLTMKISGPLLLLYLVYHVAHFYLPQASFGAYTHMPHDVHANVVNSFRVPWIVAVYTVAQILLGYHLYHGGPSLLQSLGFNHPRYNGPLRKALQGLAVVLVLGYLSVPFGVMAGLVD